MKRLSRLLVLLPALVLGWVLLSGSALQAYHWGLPAWVPRPVEHADNPMSGPRSSWAGTCFMTNACLPTTACRAPAATIRTKPSPTGGPCLKV